MKRIIALVLVMVITLGLCACGGSDGETKAEGLQVGYSKVNITPDYSVGLGGYSDYETRRSSGFITYIYLTCIALTEGSETILVYTIDLGGLSGDQADELRGAISPATGIAVDRIFIGATHTHSAPLYTNADAAGIQFQQQLKTAAAEAGKNALADRSPATIHATTATIEGMNFVRHYKMGDGTVAGGNFGDLKASPIIGHTADPDKQMVLVQFDRGEDKKDVLMVNWQAHPASGKNQIDYNSIAADFVGPMRDTLEEKSGMLVAYFTGASGNLNTGSLWNEDHHNLSWQDYGKKLGQLAYDALDGLQPIVGSGIRTVHCDYDAPIDHSWDHMLIQANEVMDLWKSMGKEAGDALGANYDFSSVYQAKIITYRAQMSASMPMQLNAFCVGGIGFTTGTYEMFSMQGQYIKENSPFDATFIITSNSTYAPCEDAYDYRSYEADTSYYAKGTGEKMAEKLTEMLKEIAPAAQ